MLKTKPGCFVAFFTKKLSTSALSAFLVCTFISSAHTQSFSAGEEDRVKELVREYILENPEIIAEAITLLQAQQETTRVKRQQQTLSELREELHNPTENTIIGNPDGPVTVIEFFDYNCGSMWVDLQTEFL